MNDPEMVLIDAGIIPEQMEFLPYKERVLILLSAGLEPELFDF